MATRAQARRRAKLVNRAPDWWSRPKHVEGTPQTVFYEDLGIPYTRQIRELIQAKIRSDWRFPRPSAADLRA